MGAVSAAAEYSDRLVALLAVLIEWLRSNVRAGMPFPFPFPFPLRPAAVSEPRMGTLPRKGMDATDAADARLSTDAEDAMCGTPGLTVRRSTGTAPISSL